MNDIYDNPDLLTGEGVHEDLGGYSLPVINANHEEECCKFGCASKDDCTGACELDELFDEDETEVEA